VNVGPVGYDDTPVISTESIALASSVATEDTALLSFGIESLASPGERADVLGRVLKPLLRR
jgi:hypothetical protein